MSEPCELCGKPTRLATAIPTPIGMLNAVVCIDCVKEHGSPGKALGVVIDARIGRVKKLFGVEYKAADDWPDGLLEPITEWVLEGTLPEMPPKEEKDG